MNHRELNDKMKVTITEFELPATMADLDWDCDECGLSLRHGILAPGQRELDTGSLVPCPKCGRVWALTYAFRLPPATPEEILDLEMHCRSIIDNWKYDE